MTAFNPNSHGRRERREHPRNTPDSTVTVEYRRRPGLTKSVAVQFLNISQGGLCVTLSEALTPKEELEISILRAGQTRPLTCVAKVCWSVPLEDGNFCVGLEFQKRLRLEDVLQIARPGASALK